MGMALRCLRILSVHILKMNALQSILQTYSVPLSCFHLNVPTYFTGLFTSHVQPALAMTSNKRVGTLRGSKCFATISDSFFNTSDSLFS